jgi:hypothetical protein
MHNRKKISTGSDTANHSVPVTCDERYDPGIMHFMHDYARGVAVAGRMTTKFSKNGGRGVRAKRAREAGGYYTYVHYLVNSDE